MTKTNQDRVAEAYNRGLDAEKAGDFDAAEAAYREVLALDQEDSGGVSVRLAAMGRSAPPAKMPDAYVATLFDQHADVFDTILVDQLGYCVPLMVVDAVKCLSLGPFDRLLDLGCGTGLTGMALADCTVHRTGVDLSERIIELAFDRQVYDDLYVGEVVDFLQDFEDDDGHQPVWDLITATDVLPYLGDVEPLFRGASARLVAGGVLAFSTETFDDPSAFKGNPYSVGQKTRFAHRLDYIDKSLKEAGFVRLLADDITVRLEDGKPVSGHLVLARKAAA
ncbi:S-adenosylmethionine-dependent methyltransferase [Roseibium aquae]|uniref:S-adenosylmethionine-dependent methyltransferase n=1 Tax=Roseibium aquae TaxID=1323746 RepID=A0A916TLM2_9HYPH|nr:methyltransferase [Roseibium aquae]GGB51685.1 S-adenosylmethionine-dependent methyltransferase [Roseibium aquae]